MPVDDAGLDFVREADRLGVESAWVPEYWGFDALTPLAAAAVATDRIRLATGIVQLGTRTPAMLAMSAMTLQHLSDGRFVLGLGTSGPQVMEGWHGVPFSRPVTRTRETIEIIRTVTRGDRLEYAGSVYELPLPGGEGKALRAAAPPTEVPIYVASLGPANLRLTGALADGWIGNSFFTETSDVFFDELRSGAVAAGRSLSDLDLTVSASVEITDDVDEAAKRHAAGFAFTFGAMGSASSNFYNNAFTRQGWGDDVAEVQRLWMSGDRQAARERVPAEIGLRTNLIGSVDDVRVRLREYRDCGVTTLRIGPMGDDLDTQIAGLGQVMDLVNEINAEPTSADPAAASS
ncbi:MAG: LLM class flavin-dependent oxidoreductase [Ilumatobacteraceae bacterium]|nr:LLM class flavin-dependent oxidoreductase [Ilumatobacteraceae bacterium]